MIAGRGGRVVASAGARLIMSALDELDGRGLIDSWILRDARTGQSRWLTF